MKSISAYIAEDGSLHQTRESAATADLVSLGFSEHVAARIVENREKIEDVFRQASGLSYIPVHYPSREVAPADTMEVV